VLLAPTAYECLRRVGDRKTRRERSDVIDGLAQEPERKGKALDPPLDGLRSARASRDRYRILYEVDDASRRVSVLFLGKRRPGGERDVYASAARLLAALLEKKE
jgi:mRNA-degrading endonuclease RelE of RelBE toxin-antitoxin system